MDDDLNAASASGFVLGLVVADELQRAACNSAAAEESALFDLVLSIADGSRAIIPDDEQLRQLLTPVRSPDAAREAVKTAALRLVESYRRTFLA